MRALTRSRTTFGGNGPSIRAPYGARFPQTDLAAAPTGAAVLGLIDCVLVENGVEFQFDGAITIKDASAVWVWMIRDLAADLVEMDAINAGEVSAETIDTLLPEFLNRAKTALQGAESSTEAARRIRTQLGGDEAWDKLPVVLNAVRSRGLLDKALSFGRATNGMTDEASLTLALQSLPLQDQAVAALLMQAAMGQIANPSRIIQAVIRLCGSASESALQRSGFGPVIDAMLAHAQNQIPSMAPSGIFSDMDLLCRAIDRFHRLMRAVTGYVELGRGSRWAVTAAALTKRASDRIEPRMTDVALNVNQALRRVRETGDRLDSDQILIALNGVFLLSTVRDSRDSLALNALFDQVWAQTGDTLEARIESNLELLRRNPNDRITSSRLDAAFKMAELRLGTEHTEVLRRAKELAERRLSPPAA